MNPELTQEKVQNLFDYNPVSGILVWRISPKAGVFAGDTAGYKNKLGYIIVGIKGKTYLAHRIIFLMVYGYMPENQVDHINRNRSDNRLSNLREVTALCNIKNNSVRADNKSGVTGVSWYAPGKKWMARIGTGEKYEHLGYFKTIEDAAIARWKAEVHNKWLGCNKSTSAFLYLSQRKLLPVRGKPQPPDSNPSPQSPPL